MINLLKPKEAEEVNIEKLEIMFKNVLDYFTKAYMIMTESMPFQYQREDDINDMLYIILQRILEEDDSYLTLNPQNYDPAQRPIHGRASQVDFAISWSSRARMKKYQFFIECKLLNCNEKNRAYIQNGIHRYTTNFYAGNLPFAAMIGYIQRGEIPTIISDLNNKLRNEVTRRILNIESYWSSVHPRNDGNQNICLYHLFFDFRDCQENPHTVRACPNNDGLIKSPLL